MRGIGLAVVALSAGAASGAAAQDDPATADMGQVVRGCVPAGQRASSTDELSAAERSAMLSCVARESARMISSRLPLRIDEITILRSVAADGPQLTYFNDVEVDAAGLSRAQSEALLDTTRDYVCSQPAMRAALTVGSSYRYIWFDQSGAEFDRMTIERCGDEPDEDGEPEATGIDVAP